MPSALMVVDLFDKQTRPARRDIQLNEF